MTGMRWDNLRLDLTERGVTERGVTERGVTERGVTERGVTERGVTERGVTEGTVPAPAGEPLLPRGAVARTFDTPGFRGMTFYEIHAKSIVSRVPEASRVPFRWTINPYRGCQHSCLLLLRAQFPYLPRPGRWA
jgi:hypothetical protein